MFIFWISLICLYMLLLLFTYNVISSVVFTCVSFSWMRRHDWVFPPFRVCYVLLVVWTFVFVFFLVSMWVPWVLQGIPCLIIALVHNPQMFYNVFISFMICHYSLSRHHREEAHFWHLCSLVKIQQRSMTMAMCSNVFPDVLPKCVGSFSLYLMWILAWYMWDTFRM
jgi:hypothetical protein